jgi:pimeloyl-ACP methyl ester carboxylesterase
MKMTSFMLTQPSGYKLACHRFLGNGPGVLLVGGYGNSSLLSPLGTKVLAWCQANSQDFVVLDFMGQGCSTGNLHDITIPTIADDIAAVSSQLSLTSRFGIAASLGGWGMLVAAAANPTIFSSLLLLAPAIDWDETFVAPRLADGRASRDDAGVITLEDHVVLSNAFLDTAPQARVDARAIAPSCAVKIIVGADDTTVDQAKIRDLVDRLRGHCDVSWRTLPDEDHQLAKLRTADSQVAFFQEAGMLLDSWRRTQGKKPS